MLARNYLLAIGAMTGNSLDGVDVVLTRFDEDGAITDLKAHSVASPAQLAANLRALRESINTAGGDMSNAVQKFDEQSADHGTFEDVQNDYIRFVAAAINELVELARQDKKLSAEYDLQNIDLIGFHGQTCAHFPPSIARSNNSDVVYTCQIGDGQALADLTGIPVVYDFRSDDLMSGGEAAPLAPVHHQHLAEQLRKKGQFPIVFCNAGNTGNLTVISVTADGGEVAVVGWDAGPFNNYPDALVQLERGEECDFDGKFGSKGKINLPLLEKLFETAVVTKDGRNYLLEPPPKSSDPQWYRLIPELTEAGSNGVSFEDRMRTVEYFSAYIYFHALSMTPDHLQMPLNFALCGGGWKNPVSREHFAGLIKGDTGDNPVLPAHKELFAKLRQRFEATAEAYPGQKIVVEMSDSFGFDGTAMEARIFADAAVCRVMAKPFTKPSTTGVKRDTVCGIIRYHGGDASTASPALASWLEYYNSVRATDDRPAIFDGRWSRASAGWHGRLAKA
jgi:anhydro-N-acetylmuramic acid kinase